MRKRFLIILTLISLFSFNSCKKDYIEHQLDIVVESRNDFFYEIYLNSEPDFNLSSSSNRASVSDLHCNTGDVLIIKVSTSDFTARISDRYMVFDETDFVKDTSNFYTFKTTIE